MTPRTRRRSNRPRWLSTCSNALGISLVVLVIAAAAVILLIVLKPPTDGHNLFTRAGADIRATIADQLLGLANRNLVPQLVFESIEYEPPLGVTVRNAALRAADGSDVILAKAVRITLREIPQPGVPVHIERIAFDGGGVYLRPNGSGGITGFDPFVRPKPRDPADTAPRRRLSEVINLRRIEINNAELIYDERVPGASPLRIDGLSLAMDIDPDPAAPGWYSASFHSGREPGLRVDALGRFNIDELLIEFADALFAIDLSEKTRPDLPPSMELAIARHDITGSVELRLAGTLPVRAPLEGALTAELLASGLHASFGDFRLPVDRLSIRGALDRGSMTLALADIAALDGAVRVSGSADTNTPGWPAILEWTADNVDIQRFLAAEINASDGPDQPPRFAGRFAGEGLVRLDLARADESLAGEGSLTVTEGRLVALPIVTALNRAIGGGRRDSGRHRLSARFSLSPDRITITEGELVTGLIAARGTGDIGYDGQLDLRVNAGPLEKLQSGLGLIGELFGNLTDRLVKYLVRGTTADPTISVAPFGLGG